MTLGVSNANRIHFGFKFIVNPDPANCSTNMCSVILKETMAY